MTGHDLKTMPVTFGHSKGKYSTAPSFYKISASPFKIPFLTLQKLPVSGGFQFLCHGIYRMKSSGTFFNKRKQLLRCALIHTSFAPYPLCQPHKDFCG